MGDPELERLLDQVESRRNEIPEDQWRSALEVWGRRVGLHRHDSWVSFGELAEAIQKVGSARNACPDPLLKPPSELAVATELADEVRRCGPGSISRERVIATLAEVVLELGLLDMFARHVMMTMDPKIFDPGPEGSIKHTDWSRLPSVICKLLRLTDPLSDPTCLRDGNGFLKALIDQMRTMLFNRVIVDHVFAVTPNCTRNESRKDRPNYENLWVSFCGRYTRHFGEAEDKEAEMDDFLSNTLKGRSLATLADSYGYAINS